MTRDLTSERIGEKLLGGWTLRADACPRDNTPLMSSRAGKFYCACEDVYWDEGSDPSSREAAAGAFGAPAASSPAPQPAAEAKPAKTSSAPEEAEIGSGARKPATSNDQAEVVAELLLGGWALLAQYCPIEGCLAPLMRNKQGKKYCPAHDLWVFTEKERRADGAQTLLQSPTRRPAAEAAASQQPSEPQQRSTAARALAPALAAPAAAVGSGTSSSAELLAAAAEVARAAIARRMVALADTLDRADPGDAAATVQILDALERCSASAQALAVHRR